MHLFPGAFCEIELVKLVFLPSQPSVGSLQESGLAQWHVAWNRAGVPALASVPITMFAVWSGVWGTNSPGGWDQVL